MAREPMNYITWSDNEGFQQALKATANNLNSYTGISHGDCNYYASSNPDVTYRRDREGGRDDYHTGFYDYAAFSDAPGNMDMATWQSMQDIYACMRAYQRVSIVRQVVDMMSDFTTMGIRIVHPNKKIENFLKHWAKVVDFYEVSERISNMLYRTGNCPIRFRHGKVPQYFENEWKKGFANIDDNADDITLQKQERTYRSIPLSYTVMDPLSVDVVGGSLAVFLGKPLYALRISQIYKNVLIRIEKESVTNNQAKDLLKFMPDKLRQAIKGRRPMIPIDPDKIEVLFYKKDDWSIWASPMLAAILEPLDMLDKMHKSDRAALNGAMSQIRLWTLGDVENKILPTRAMLNRLRDELAKVGDGSTLDLVWGPGLDFKESNSQLHHFLDSSKYHQVMTEIYMGLGVPPSLTGSPKGNDGGFTNNSISMKIMIERLEYGRKILVKFWENQLAKIQLAMGWRFPAKVIFDYQALNDANDKALMLDLIDREIIPHETALELFKRDPELENMRLKRESKKRDSGVMPPKASPYHNPQQDHDMNKILMQGGHVAPSQVGIELEDRKPGEETPKDKEMRTQLKMHKMSNDHNLEVTKDNNRTSVKLAKYGPTSPGGDGRPKNSNDKKKRKQKTVKPRTTAFTLYNWANNTQSTIAEIINPFFLQKFDKKTMRSLTNAQMEQVEELKFIVLSNLEPYIEVTPEIVYNILKNGAFGDPNIKELAQGTIKDFEEKYDRQPTLEETRQIKALAYSNIKGVTNVPD